MTNSCHCCLGCVRQRGQLVVEALSHAENYPLILKYLGAAHDFVGSLSAPVAVEKELVDPMFYVTATIWCIALDDPCIFKSAWDTDITLEDNVPLTSYGEKICRSGCFVFSSLLVGTDGMERAVKVRDDIISIVALNGADAVRQYKRAVEDRFENFNETHGTVGCRYILLEKELSFSSGSTLKWVGRHYKGNGICIYYEYKRAVLDSGRYRA